MTARSGTSRTVGMVLGCLLVSLLLAGCLPQVAKNPDSAYYKIPPDSVIRLDQQIIIPVGRTRIWIQDGRIAGTGFNSFVPSCNVEVTRLDEENPQYVMPGDFRITRTQFLREAISSTGPRMVAGRGDILLAESVDSSGGDEFYHEGYHLWVDNPEQPGVRRFTCRGLYGFPYETRPPSITEIRTALGPVATLILPQGAE